VVAPCSTTQEAEEEGQREMDVSEHVAAAVALRQLGYHVTAVPNGVLVSQLIYGTNAPCKLQPTDVVLGVDGKPTPTLGELHTLLGKVKPGAVVTLRIRRGGRLLDVRVRTVDDHGRALVGFAPEQSVHTKLPIPVSIDAGPVGGPSAGLAFTLEVMEKLGHDVVHGHRVAATGEMQLDGSVTPIGGVEQKTYGAREAGVDYFLVPAGANARTARRYAGPLHIIPVTSLSQALHALATLPPAG
jgi:PDZ domain-containing protein